MTIEHTESTGTGDTPELDTDASAFLSNLMGEEDEREDPKASSEEPEADREEPEADQEDGEADPEDDKEKAEADPDDAEVELDVGTEKHRAKLRDLKAAYAAQAEVTARQAEVAQRLSKVAADEARATEALSKVVAKAKERWEPYSKLDFLALSRDPSIDQETFQQLRKEAQEALTDYRYFTEELDGQVAAKQNEAKVASQATAQATVAALSNPETGIKGWGPELYGEILGYADTIGAPAGHSKTIVAEWALRALHKAYLYDKGLKAASTKMEKVVAKPTRVLQSGKAGSSASPSAAGTTKTAMATLRKSGTVDDAAGAFFASFGVDD